MAEEVITTEQSTEESTAKKELAVFWVRMIGWLSATLGVPITTFAIKFGLFTSSGYETTTDELGNITSSTVALNGWGLVSCVLIGFTAINILKEVIDAYSQKYTLAKQCLVGIKDRLIPLLIGIVICYFLKGVIDQVTFCLIVIGISQIIAIPLNPLPKWVNDTKGSEDYRDLLSSFTDVLKKFNKKEGK